MNVINEDKSYECGIWIHGPTHVSIYDCQAFRYWVHQPVNITGDKEIDDRLSSFPVIVALPQQVNENTAVVFGLQGMGVPLTANYPLVPHLLSMNIAVCLFDTPLGGERSYLRTHDGQFGLVKELVNMSARDLHLDVPTLYKVFDATSRDFALIRDRILRERHGLKGDRIALFGVSLGVLISSFAFLRDGFGHRLLGCIGVSDINSFSRTFGGRVLPWLASTPLGVVGEVILKRAAPDWAGFVPLMRILRRLQASSDEQVQRLNPMSYLTAHDNTHRRVRYLLGEHDPLVSIASARQLAASFPDAQVYVVPGLGHGKIHFGPGFDEHVKYYLSTQLEDWK